MSANRQLSLAELQQALAQWIRAQVLGLLDQHRANEIKVTLGINHGMLKQWKAQCNSPSGTHQAVAPSEFVALLPLGCGGCEASRERVLALTLSRHGSDGSTVSVSGTLSWGEWHQALRLLSAGEASR